MNLRHIYNTGYFLTFWEGPRRVKGFPQILNRLAPYPSFLEVEVTTRCNLRCSICEHTYWDEPGKDMSLEEFKFIVDQFPNLKWIGLTGIGESFLNPNFMEMLWYVRNKGILVELYDTMYFVDDRWAKALVGMGLTRLFISLDAATGETYQKIRVGSDWRRVTSNIATLLDIKGSAKSKYPHIGFHFIVTKDNMHEMPQYIEWVWSLQPPGQRRAHIQFSRMLHPYKQVRGLFTEVPEEIIKDTKERARRLGVRVVWGLDVPSKKPPIKECIEWTMPFIFVDGTVVPCCAGNEANARELQRTTALGNIFERPFKTLWKEEYKELRTLLRAGKLPAACKNCSIYEVPS